MGLVRVERIEDVLGMSPSAWARAITDYVFGIDEYASKESEPVPTRAEIIDLLNKVEEYREKENKDMNEATSENGTTFKAGDQVVGSINSNIKGVIVKLIAEVELKRTGSIITSQLNLLTHYDGPTDEEDAWERVTMDIGVAVSDQIGENGYTSQLYESDRRAIRHGAYVVLGSVMKVDETVKARVRGIIERAEKRFNGQN